MISKLSEKYGDVMYFIFRLLIGGLFFLHGLQKLFGLFGGQIQQLFGLFWWAGAFEFVLGITVVLGLFTRLSGIIGAIEMVVAYVVAHMPQGAVPIENGGELALLYFGAFLVLIIYGGRKWSVDDLLNKNPSLKKLL